MDNETLQIVTDEILPILQSKRIGKIFQTAQNQLTIDFRPGDGRYLFLNFEPSLTPRLYLVRRRVRDLEKQSDVPSNFVLFTRKRLANAQLRQMSKDENDRVMRFEFLSETEAGEVEKFRLIAQFAGRSANLFLVDAENRILKSLRETFGDGQQTGQIYAPPKFDSPTASIKKTLLETISKIEPPKSDFDFSPPSPISEKLDAHFLQIENEREFETAARAATNRLNQEFKKKEKLFQRLSQDLIAHGEPERLKKNGDLLLANLKTARRVGNQFFVTDFFDETAPEVAIETDENSSMTEAAEKFFRRYTKARNAAQELTKRIEITKSEIEKLKAQQETLEKIIAQHNLESLLEFAVANKFSLAKPKSKAETKEAKRKEPEKFSGARRYRSSDNLEILVGRAAKDNDYLTFRVAKSLDWWLHAADYSGSHVVVRNPSRGELPSTTLLEAAQLAAKFSQAKSDSKVAVHYTQRKFVGKIKNGAPGLVRLASFRTILVEPKETVERILD